ncbi:hypothetical protein NLJ89_g11533 [Agrocybe chaxingu]|uniref:Uncharacterized protein n=1 Tax=Agrocybe chaxingu TaxID=84603 RepID=A0A9W8JPS5_9AGAR|nr:hypothetical protein NLJ89_g11533 [Agrocybe chaxingu]
MSFDFSNATMLADLSLGDFDLKNLSLEEIQEVWADIEANVSLDKALFLSVTQHDMSMMRPVASGTSVMLNTT